MKKQRLFKLAAVTLLVMGTLAATSCKKNEVTISDGSAEIVKGGTLAKIETITLFVSGNNDTTPLSLSDIYDISVEVAAGSEVKTGTLSGNSLNIEAVTTTIPSTGKITATVTPKQSFLDGIDSSKKYTFVFNVTSGYYTVDNYGKTHTEQDSNKLSHIGIKGTRMAEFVTEVDSIIEYALGDGTTYEFKN